jgi:hypothetical protein
MKKIILLLSITLASSTINAQYMLNKGDAQLNAGLGFSGWGVPVYLGFDYGVHQDISVGAELSFRSYNYSRYSNYNYRISIYGISANGNYHFNTLLKIPTKYDFYAGVNLGFYIWSYPNDNYRGNEGISHISLGAQIGGRYYFNDKLAINLEFGGGNAFGGGKIGLSYKF